MNTLLLYIALAVTAWACAPSLAEFCRATYRVVCGRD